MADPYDYYRDLDYSIHTEVNLEDLEEFLESLTPEEIESIGRSQEKLIKQSLDKQYKNAFKGQNGKIDMVKHSNKPKSDIYAPHREKLFRKTILDERNNKMFYFSLTGKINLPRPGIQAPQAITLLGEQVNVRRGLTDDEIDLSGILERLFPDKDKPVFLPKKPIGYISEENIAEYIVFALGGNGLSIAANKWLSFKPYVKWIIITYAKDGINYWEDVVTKAIPYIDKFIKVKSKLPAEKRDINRCRTLGDLMDIIDDYENKQIIANRDLDQTFYDSYKAALLYRDDDHEVIYLMTFEGSCHFGQGSRWCTAIPGRPNNFEYYNENGDLYVVRDLKNFKNTCQLHVSDTRDEHDYRNWRDESVDINNIPSNILDIIVYEHVKASPVKKGEEFFSVYPFYLLCNLTGIKRVFPNINLRSLLVSSIKKHGQVPYLFDNYELDMRGELLESTYENRSISLSKLKSISNAKIKGSTLRVHKTNNKYRKNRFSLYKCEFIPVPEAGGPFIRAHIGIEASTSKHIYLSECTGSPYMELYGFDKDRTIEIIRSNLHTVGIHAVLASPGGVVNASTWNRLIIKNCSIEYLRLNIEELESNVDLIIKDSDIGCDYSSYDRDYGSIGALRMLMNHDGGFFSVSIHIEKTRLRGLGDYFRKVEHVLEGDYSIKDNDVYISELKYQIHRKRGAERKMPRTNSSSLPYMASANSSSSEDSSEDNIST